jgi:beta-galactosidase
LIEKERQMKATAARAAKRSSAKVAGGSGLARSAMGMIPCGKGRIVVLTLDICDNVSSPDGRIHVAKKQPRVRDRGKEMMAPVAVDKLKRADYSKRMERTIMQNTLAKRITVHLSVVALVAGLLAGTSAKAAAPVNAQQRARITMSFDPDWRFLKADASGAEQPDFNDAEWRALNVPHDWSIEGPFDQNSPTRGAGGFLPSGGAWYRKHFTLPADYAQRRVFIDFDGVMANSDVWINGFHLGKRPFGYVSFRYELTGHLNFGNNKPNVLAVRADTSQQPASRWYTGAGIYRHVRLVVTEPVHIDQWGTFVTTPKIASDQATVHVQNTVVNQSDTAREVALQITLLGPDGRWSIQTVETKPQTVPAGKSVDFQQDIIVKNPKRWALDHPVLYRAVTKVRAGNAMLDDEITSFSIRDARFEADTGFWLNGKNFKIKGVCLHHDGSAFGAAVPLGVWEHRLTALQKLGVNAIRTAHNPPAPEFLDLCDRMGFLVMDETFDCWTVAKNPYDYHLYFNEWSKIDTRDTVRRDRNHPSIILYSTGNEIHDTPKEDLAKSILSGLVPVFHENDPIRPVTQALFRPNVSHDYDNGLADMLDVIGTNYRDTELLAAQKAKPTRKIVGTEQRHDRQTWLNLRDHPSHSGQFLWSGVDYLGESRAWPTVAAGSGLLDRTGTPKPMAYERQSWWLDKPMVYAVRRTAPTATQPTDPGYAPLAQRQVLFPDWTPQDSKPHDENVEVYSNCEQVGLFLNGKSLGAKLINADASPRTWKVAFAPGTLKAIGKNKGRVVATHELRTAGKPAQIVLTANRNKLTAGWDDVSFVTAMVVDKNGVRIPDASDLITFKVKGPGVIAAVDNADNTSHEPFQATERHAFRGRCVAILKATAPSGRITVSASAPNLTSGSITISAVPATATR